MKLYCAQCNSFMGEEEICPMCGNAVTYAVDVDGGTVEVEETPKFTPVGEKVFLRMTTESGYKVSATMSMVSGSLYVETRTDKGTVSFPDFNVGEAKTVVAALQRFIEDSE